MKAAEITKKGTITVN